MKKNVLALTVDDDHALTWFPPFFARHDIRTIPVEDGVSAMNMLRQISVKAEALDVITTDLTHPEPDGFALIQWIRSLPDEMVIAGGLRLRHIPIVVYSCCANIQDYRQRIKEIDHTIPIIDKATDATAGGKNIFRSIYDSIAEYRNNLLSELQHVGLAIVWRDGKYQVLDCYSTKPNSIYEGKYYLASSLQLGREYGRLVLIDQLAKNAASVVEQLECILNDPRTREGDLHHFFELHPEFLYRNTYISHWSEPMLHSRDGKLLKPDFILEPVSLYKRNWAWEIVELKRQDAPLLTNKRLHKDFSSQVYHAVAQLRDYYDYFTDPRNEDLLKQRFGGVVPRPTLTLVIGRLPKSAYGDLASLQQRIPDVKILTYDEILEFRRTHVEQLQFHSGRWDAEIG